MISEKHVMRGAVLALAVGMVGLAVQQRRASADGVPGMNPMTYSGTLEEGGAPVSGSRNIRLTVWDDASATESSHIRCITAAPGTTVTSGRFQIPLDNTCTAVMRSTPDLWVEVEVAGMSLGRTKVSAVPFAVEAGRAADLAPTARNSLVPPGTVVAFGGPAAPDGWLLCDGRAVSRATYATLFAAIGTSHGGGDGAMTFNLPDLRGRFVRGADLGAGRDPDRTTRTAASAGGNVGDAVGTLQPGQLASHVHNTRMACAAWNYTGGTNNCFLSVYGYGNTNAYFTDSNDIDTQPTGGNETRPVNVAMNYIVKF